MIRSLYLPEMTLKLNPTDALQERKSYHCINGHNVHKYDSAIHSENISLHLLQIHLNASINGINIIYEHGEVLRLR